jgi:hypothetical protein
MSAYDLLLNSTHHTRIAARSVLVATLLASSGSWSAAQPSTAASAPVEGEAGSLELLKQRWKEMSPEQRARVRENFERWQTLDETERQVMRDRFERWRKLQTAVSQDLDETVAAEETPADPADQRERLVQRTKEFVQSRLQQMPRELQDRLQEELEGLSLQERRQRVRSIVNEEISVRIGQHLTFLTRRGLVEREEAEVMRQRLQGLDPIARYEALREWILAQPELFQVPEYLQQSMAQSHNPYSVMRALERFNQRLDDARIHLEAFLRERGVSEEEIRALTGGSNVETRLRLRSLLDQHGLELPEALKVKIKLVNQRRREEQRAEGD